VRTLEMNEIYEQHHNNNIKIIIERKLNKKIVYLLIYVRIYEIFLQVNYCCLIMWVKQWVFALI
jgi:hypothetical protein